MTGKRGKTIYKEWKMLKETIHRKTVDYKISQRHESKFIRIGNYIKKEREQKYSAPVNMCMEIFAV